MYFKIQSIAYSLLFFSSKVRNTLGEGPRFVIACYRGEGVKLCQKQGEILHGQSITLRSGYCLETVMDWCHVLRKEQLRRLQVARVDWIRLIN